MNTAIATTNTASLSLVVDNTKELMSSLDIAENVLNYRHDNLKAKIEEIVSKGIFSQPEIQVITKLNARNQNRKVSVYMLDERSSHILVAHIDPKRTAQLYDAWASLRKENEELKQQVENPFANMSKLDWMRKAVELEEEKQQLIDLHVRKSVDAHSMTRLLGEKRGSLLVQKALNALKEAGYIERVYDDVTNKPKGYIANDNSLTFCRMNAHFQLEFTVDVLPVLVSLGVLEEEQKETLRLPHPNNTLLIQNKAAQKIRESANSLTLVGFGI
ncbi:Rha family transcriptional regulator [Salmonella enterica]|nr:Rha family transcriptional regulator [Salmonella enterica]EJI3407500.1 Rha family transcriptional regulator [Salmonella enterica]